MSWSTPKPRWDTMAGRVLDAFFSAVQEAMPGYDQPLTIFGSAPIQLCLDEGFASADVDIMVFSESEKLRGIAGASGLGRSGTIRPAYGVQICPPQLFKPTPHYLQRAHVEVRHGLTVVMPHLRDILTGKLHRFRFEGQQGLVAKDSRAVQRVRELCPGHPTLDEVLEDLVQCESFFRPPLDGGVNAFRLNVEDLLADHYGHRFDLEKDILVPSRLAAAGATLGDVDTVAEMIRNLRPTRD